MKGTTTIAKMSALIRRGNIDVAFLGMLRDFLETAPYCQDANTEGHYQQMMYVIFSILNPYVDMVLRTAKHLHLFKLKLNKDAETAMRHIDLKQYPKHFMLCGLPIVKSASTSTWRSTTSPIGRWMYRNP